jgi:hypothetical protein
MEFSRLLPGRLSARGCIECKDQARLSLGHRLNGLSLPKERGNIARTGAVKVFWNENALGRAGREQSAITELAKIVASVCQLRDHRIECFLVEYQAVTAALAADQFHEFTA